MAILSGQTEIQGEIAIHSTAFGPEQTEFFPICICLPGDSKTTESSRTPSQPGDQRVLLARSAKATFVFYHFSLLNVSCVDFDKFLSFWIVTLLIKCIFTDFNID